MSSENSHLNILVIDIDDVHIDHAINKITFKKEKMNFALLDTIRKNKTLCVINKLDKKEKEIQVKKKYISEVEGLNHFIFISCANQTNIHDLLSQIKEEVNIMLFYLPNKFKFNLICSFNRE